MNLNAVRAGLMAASILGLDTMGRVSKGSFRGPAAKPVDGPGSPCGRNEPCPCGSGKKYKACCRRTLAQ